MGISIEVRNYVGGAMTHGRHKCRLWAGGKPLNDVFSSLLKYRMIFAKIFDFINQIVI